MATLLYLNSEACPQAWECHKLGYRKQFFHNPPCPLVFPHIALSAYISGTTYLLALHVTWDSLTLYDIQKSGGVLLMCAFTPFAPAS